MALVTILPLDKPRNISAPSKASSSVSIFLSVAYFFLDSEISVLSFRITPLLSNITIFLGLTPNATYNLVHDIAEAPAPFTTNFILRSEEHTSELQSRPHLVCRLLLEKKKKKT